MLSYSEKLRDPRWLSRRQHILQRADFRCEECDEPTRGLHVHHKLYRSGAEPWEYGDDELVALCSGCHADRHDADRVIREAIGHAKLDFVTRIHLALIVLGFCAATSKESERRCRKLAGSISEAACGSYFFICGFTAAKGDPRMKNPLRIDDSALATLISDLMQGRP
jgi:hypothetical protein